MISPATLATIGATRPPSSVIQPARAPAPGSAGPSRLGTAPPPPPAPTGAGRGSLLDISV